MSLFAFLKKVFCCGKKTCASGKAPRSKEKEIGAITHYYGNLSVGIIKLNGTLRVGDTVHIRGVHDDFSQKIDSMQLNHQDIQEASKGAEVGVKLIRRAHENDKVYVPLA